MKKTLLQHLKIFPLHPTKQQDITKNNIKNPVLCRVLYNRKSKNCAAIKATMKIVMVIIILLPIIIMTMIIIMIMSMP